MEREFYYLLPDGVTTADNMKEGCEILTRQAGHPFSSNTFRNLIRKGVIKKLTRDMNSIMTRRDASYRTSETDR